MKRKSLKKSLLMALMTTMVFASAFTVEAASGGSAGSSGKGETREESVNEEPVATGASDTSKPFENVNMLSAGANIAVAGSNVKSTIAGAYAVKSLQGAAVTTPLADIKASLNLKDGQTPYIMAFDTDAKKSPLAMDCVNAAISTQGGTLITAINVDLGARENGRLVSLKNGSAALAVGLPKNADTDKTYYVVCVQPGGAISILKDQDSNPKTVTFEIRAGLSLYALVAK